MISSYGEIWLTDGIQLPDLPLLAALAGAAAAIIVCLLYYVISRSLRALYSNNNNNNDNDNNNTSSADDDVTEVMTSRCEQTSLIPDEIQDGGGIYETMSSTAQFYVNDRKYFNDVEAQDSERSEKNEDDVYSTLGSVTGLVGVVNSEYVSDDEDLRGGVKNCDRPLGRLWFSVVFDDVTEKLFIRVIKAKYLQPRDKSSALRDPYVKVYLLPDETSRQESRVIENTLSPHFDQTFVFNNERSDLIRYKSVRLSVYDVDSRRVRHTLGHVVLPLAGYDVTTGAAVWRDLQPDESLSNWKSHGEISVSLNCDSSSQSFTVTINETRNLRQSDVTADHVIRVRLHHGGHVVDTRYTVIQKLNSRQTYDKNSFTFLGPPDLCSSCYVTIVILVKTAVASVGRGEKEEGVEEKVVVDEGREESVEREEEELGEYGFVLLGSAVYAASAEASKHWHAAASRPGQLTHRWHALQPGTGAGTGADTEEGTAAGADTEIGIENSADTYEICPGEDH